MNLNDKQKLAVESEENYIRVVAGAGSGKTSVLTQRIKRLLEKGANPKSILAITFTNKAANEMKQRVGNDDVLISTIHSLCVKILREEYWTRNFRILDSDEQLSVIEDICEENKIDEKVFKPKEMLNLTLGYKVHRLDEDFKEPKGYPDELFYKGYIEKLRKLIAMDFDDLILNVAELFMKSKEAKTRWAEKFEYILVDEFQDTDRVQYRVIKDLTSVHHRLFVVGDGDQMIYTWRGAEEEIFNNFDEDFPGCQTIILNQNYRSTKNILDAANRLIHNNVKRIAKDLFSKDEEGPKINVRLYNDDKEEAKEIVDEIEAKSKDCSYKDFAVLYRANYLSKPIERELAKRRIPYQIYGGFKFYDRKEVKDLIAYLKFINYEDDLSLKRIINVPSRKIGKTKVKSISDLSAKLNKTMYEVLRDKDYTSPETDSFMELINDLKKLNYEDILPELIQRTDYYSSLDSEDNMENCLVLIEEVKEYKQEFPESTLQEYLEEVALFSDMVKTKGSDTVSLMTIHTAKGLEFKHVYVIGMTEGKFPKNNYEFDEEERRLAYVAITRAKEYLTLCSERKGFNGYSHPSVFIDEVGGFTEKKPEINTSSFRRNYWY